MAGTGLVGGFPTLADINRRTFPQPKNPLDVSTIFSILPLEINENKITVQPSFYSIPKGSIDSPAYLYVEGGSWWKEMDETQPLLEIQVNSMQLAEAIVKDYANSMVGFLGDGGRPGVFSIPGRITVAHLKAEYPGMLIKAVEGQTAWYKNLTKLADALWSRSNGNPLAISDIMRLAARELGLNKEWLQDFQMIEQERCKACGTFKSVNFPICPTCKAVTNEALAKQLDIKFAIY